MNRLIPILAFLLATILLQGTLCQKERDSDGDGVPDKIDNCPEIPNSDQTDTDQDQVGDTCDRCVQENPNGSPNIQIITTTASSVSGCVFHVVPNSIHVVFFAKTDKWYVQPFVDDPYTEVENDGYWESFTNPWEVLAAYIVTPNLPIPATSDNPLPLEVDNENVLAMSVYPPEYLDEISRSFAGFTFYVKTGNGLGPGPNNWRSEHVWVDSGGALHLKIGFIENAWYCAEVIGPALGYGTYTFTISSPIDMLDAQAVGSPFLYLDDNNEIDIEFSRWGNPNAVNNAQFVVQPYAHSGNLDPFPIALGEFATSVHQFKWSRDSISFRSVRGNQIDSDENLVHQWTYTGTDIPTTMDLKLHINLWLYQGKPPINGQAQEMIISSFSFLPE